MVDKSTCNRREDMDGGVTSLTALKGFWDAILRSSSLQPSRKCVSSSPMMELSQEHDLMQGHALTQTFSWSNENRLMKAWVN